ncbi:DUF3010 domain-containing protein [Pokkaliibacter plantistimulans]|uniref:DUF3010 domain-containing protein n=1 Tax=Proteobacteria bacterium 228 TaxID=2083153 RepID=A0A2S5KJE7_9PROT|nr:DUF3010 family protein [Pokkaliibacter plantistimulans]PPC74908.1 DUF3010 domain-containing protein [Pokkaliibacter plantistimulans]
MRVCGVEFKGGEAIVALLERDRGLFHWLPCRTSRITLKDDANAEGIRHFQFTFAKLIEDYKVDHVAMISRPHKGRFAGEGATFKMETAIQLIENLNSTLLEPSDIKSVLSRFPVNEQDIGVKRFQKEAFLAAYTWLNKQLAGTE